MNHVRLITAAIATIFYMAAHASPNSDALGQCLSDGTSGKDKKNLAKWIFVGMSAHPELANIAKASIEDIEAAQRTVGILMTRLISETCPDEMRAVVKLEGSEGIKVAFEFLGKMAMQELMTNPEVNGAIGGFERFLDKSKIEAIIKPKQ